MNYETEETLGNEPIETLGNEPIEKDQSTQREEPRVGEVRVASGIRALLITLVVIGVLIMATIALQIALPYIPLHKTEEEKPALSAIELVAALNTDITSAISQNQTVSADTVKELLLSADYQSAWQAAQNEGYALYWYQEEQRVLLYDTTSHLIAYPITYTSVWTEGDKTVNYLTAMQTESGSPITLDPIVTTTQSDVSSAYTRTGDVVFFGTYPQSRVTDNALVSQLQNLATAQTTNQDVVYQGVRYHGVGTESGFLWYQYQSIEWNIVAEAEGTALLVSDTILDSRIFDTSRNDYAFSAIRTWLDDTFYNSAFNTAQKELIVDSNLGEITAKVFLLSQAEAESLGSSEQRVKEHSAYAAQRGLYSNAWWLRSAATDGCARYVAFSGNITEGSYSRVSETGYGVVPALRIAFCRSGHVFGAWNVTKSATCTETGIRQKVCMGCGELRSESIAALGHLPQVDAAVAPTCLDGGLTAGSHCERCSAILTAQQSVSALGHDAVHHAAKAATCTTDGYAAYDTCSRCDYTTYQEVEAPGHEIVHHDGKAATCTETGWDAYDTCARCDYTTYQAVGALGHNYVDLTCTLCGITCNVTDIYTRTENYIYFGSYPQDLVSNTALSASLTAQAGELPTADNAADWTDYGYYISGTQSGYMWYIDIGRDNERYRGVYFTQYRPDQTNGSSNSSNSNQDDNGYYLTTVYWFRYVPIKWRVLHQDGQEAVLLSEIALDCKEIYPEGTTHDGGYASNYETSFVRRWLNGAFYETAFSTLERQLILQTAVNNDVGNEYSCPTTYDYVYLLSKDEVTNPDYGFSTDSTDSARRKAATEYAKCQGAYIDGSISIYTTYAKGNIYYWITRTPVDHANVYIIRSDGNITSGGVSRTWFGVAPAIRIKLG